MLSDHAGFSHPFLGMGLGPMELGKLTGVLTKIGKFDIVLMYDVSIARLSRLIPIIKLTLVYYEKRERKKQVLLYSILISNNMFCIYII